jgi:hypothetical protein
MKKSLFIVLSILTLSCNNEETSNQSNNKDLKLVTGINLRQNFDDPPVKLGNPNVLVNNKFSIYPNPAQNMVSILAQDNVTDVWLVPATPEKIYQSVNFSSILTNNLFSEQSINSNSIISVNSQSSNNLMINLETLEKGYYKVFVKIDGVIYWDNLYKYDSQTDSSVQFTAINAFWN